ncbi:polysaccharide deacetylase family protein [Mucilaginibacter koreensis]
MYLIKTPWWLKRLYPQLLWNMPRHERTLYITFDDGPIPDVTPFVLATLRQYQAKATFFCIGDNVRKHPDLYQQVIADGHAIGNHTFNHLKGWVTEDDVYIDNYRQADELLNAPLFRPPYGRMKRSQIKLLQQARPDINIVMWDVLSGDFDINLDPDKCLRHTLKHTENGSIIVFHDSLKAFPRLKYVLPRVLEVWKEEGYAFKTL